MKDKILMLVIGILIGVVVSTGCFLVMSALNKNSAPTQGMGQMGEPPSNNGSQMPNQSNNQGSNSGTQAPAQTNNQGTNNGSQAPNQNNNQNSNNGSQT